MNKTITIPARFERLADTNNSVAAIQTDENLIKLVWTTGFTGIRNDAAGSYYETLLVTDQAVDLSRLNNKAPVLANHDSKTLDSVIGVTERAWIENGIGYAEVRLSSRPEVSGIVSDIKAGILRNVSVGYQITQMIDVSKRGDKVPTYQAAKWMPFEISIVSVPFDPKAQTLRSLSDIENQVEIINPQGTRMAKPEDKDPKDGPEAEEAEGQEVERAGAQAAVIAADTDPNDKVEKRDDDEEEEDRDMEVKAVADTDPNDADKNPPPAPAKEKRSRAAVKADAIQSERTRTLEISKAVSASGLSADFATDLIGRGLKVSEASKEIFKALESKQVKTSGLNRTQKETTDMSTRTMVEAAILHRMNPSKHALPAEALQFKGQSLLRAYETIVAREVGESTSSYATRIMQTSDLPSLLANVADKQLRIAYEEASPTFKIWAGQKTLTDFKQAKLVNVSVFPAMQAVAEGANYPSSTISDTAETVTLSSYGQVLSFSRQMLVNDDLSVLASFATRAAAAATRNLEGLAYGVLTSNAVMADTNALFSTAHKNIATAGASGALSIASLSAAKSAMRKQTDPSGAPLNLTPAYLIVGPDQETAAMQLVSSTLVPNSTSAVNPFMGTLKVIVSPRITSSTAWYLAADQSMIDTVNVYLLEGQEAPSVTSRIHFENGALDIKVIHDAAAAAVDFRGLYYSAGV